MSSEDKPNRANTEIHCYYASSDSCLSISWADRLTRYLVSSDHILIKDESPAHRVAYAGRIQKEALFLFIDLMGRSVDSLLGVFTGVFAFYLNQTNPRTAPPRGENLMDLIRWKREMSRASRSEQIQSGGVPELEEMLAGLLKEEEKAP
ncbi:hypothetical protein A7U60_g5003 [Sanghuangporus baumii]|uniref:Uncharacterized protein n=1 Tax=Sanghuangporus baumii TaxID=108892 RepID=A0A9Q5HXV9_SANBA|nr:hypothetical protein A7U60_g5003 [Sanghuangporus baumii]